MGTKKKNQKKGNKQESQSEVLAGKKSFSPKWVLLVVLIVGTAGGGFYYWGQQEKETVLFPQMQVKNSSQTIQWEPQGLSPSQFEGNPTDHPGFLLAQKHCVRCHLQPNPNQIPRERWPFVMTWMSNYLGYRNIYGPFHIIVNEALIPPKPLVSKKEFQTLTEYYLLFSPKEKDMLAAPAVKKSPLTQFQPIVPKMDIPPEELITLVHFDDANKHYYIGRGTKKVLQLYNTQGKMMLNAKADSEPVDIELIPRGFRMSILGDFLRDRKMGQVIDIVSGADRKLQTNRVVENYPRLTQTHSYDLNQDNIKDLLLIGFGEGEVGKVSIFWKNKDGSTQGEKVLINYGGALNAEIFDFNQDGLKDIMILTSQSKQELLLFLNEGQGNFRRQVILKNFAGFGYNFFALNDFNQDELPDLLLVNGNNMEIENAPLKPYHGVRIFENNGDLTFTEKYFYRMYGALKALAKDFDQDGDLDIAAIAFYPDWSLENPETFAYLENQGNYQFQPSVLSKEHWGRWITMTTGDVDSDGNQDIIVGGGYTPLGVNLNFYEKFQEKIKNKPSVVVFRNTGRKEN